MITVLIANGIMDSGGTETLIMEMLRHNSGRVRYIMLIHYMGKIRKGIYDDEITELGVPIVHIPSIGTVGVGKYLKAFNRIVGGLGQIDIIHSHLNANGGIIAKAARSIGIGVRICHCHADIRYNGGWIQRAKDEIRLMLLKSIIAKNATDFWACSDEAWDRLFFKNKKRVVIPNMIDVSHYLSSPEKKMLAKERWGLSSKYVLGSVGRVAPIKNYELALKVTSELNKVKEAHFICFGRFSSNDPYYTHLMDLAEKNGICNRVHFVGNSTLICEDIHCIDVFLMPSITEGFGMAAIEAQAAGIPSILSTGVPSKVDVGLGLVSFVQPNDIRAWVEAISHLGSHDVHDDVIMKHFIDFGYNSSSSVAYIENLYLELVRNN